MKKYLLLLLVPAIVSGQRISTLTRGTSTTGLNDSALVAGVDSATRARAFSLAQYRKALSVVAFDSGKFTGLLTANGSILQAANTHIQFSAADTLLGTVRLKDTVAGTPKWLSTQTLPGLVFSPTTSGITGTTTNDAASAGIVGEILSHTTATASSVGLSTGTTATIDSLSLTAGDWDVTGAVDFTFGATTSYTNLVGGLSTTRSTIGAQDAAFDYETSANVPTAGSDATWIVPVVQFSVASTTKVYLIVQGTFTVSTLKAYGTIRARRIR